MNVVLLEPEIPPNTGNIARLCAVTRSVLHLVGPLGFRLDDKQLKRAGMDYWNHLTWHHWKDWNVFREQCPPKSRFWFIEAGGPRHYAEVAFQPDDYLIFGRETLGLPKDLLSDNKDHWLRIPMFHPKSRSLNLYNCAAIVLFEALRQLSFPGETADGV